jgi:hypothetical protein
LYHGVAKRPKEKEAAPCQEYPKVVPILEERLAYVETDSQQAPNLVPVVLRIDAGFSTGPNLTWLIAMDYVVLTKAHNGATDNSLWRTILAIMSAAAADTGSRAIDRHRLGQMRRLDLVAAGQVGDGARQLQNPMVRPGAHAGTLWVLLYRRRLARRAARKSS